MESHSPHSHILHIYTQPWPTPACLKALLSSPSTIGLLYSLSPLIPDLLPDLLTAAGLSHPQVPPSYSTGPSRPGPFPLESRVPPTHPRPIQMDPELPGPGKGGAGQFIHGVLPFMVRSIDLIYLPLWGLGPYLAMLGNYFHLCAHWHHVVPGIEPGLLPLCFPH